MNGTAQSTDNRKRLKRYQEIMDAIRKNGLGFLFVRAAFVGPERALDRAEKEHGGLSIGARVRAACEQLGPTFVKIGQMLSTRTDIIPESIADELAKLQDDVPQFSFEEAREEIEAQLQEEISTVYQRFDPKPIAAASMSQVYSAYLQGGRHVAVKVQRPHIREQIDVDLSILAQLAAFLDKHTKYGSMYDFSGMVEELTKSMNREMDFVREGENLERFREIVSHHDDVTAPGVVWSYTTHTILTMDFVSGIKINDVDALDAIGANKHRIAHDFVESLMEQILVYGFFHADPHPGNVMVVDKGRMIEFIDLGMVGTLTPRFRNDLNNLVLGIALQNMRKVATAIMGMDMAGATVNQYKLTKDVGILLDEYLYVPLDQVNVAEVFSKIFDLAGEYGMKIPRDLTMVGKCLGTAQGVVQELDPSLSVLRVAEDTVRVVFRDRFRSRDFRNSVVTDIMDGIDVAHETPRFLLNLFHKLEDNDFGIQLHFEGLDDLEQSIERMANRISFCIILLAIGIVMAGIIVGVNMYSGPADTMRYNLSLASLVIGLILAGIIVFGIILNILLTSHKTKK